MAFSNARHSDRYPCWGPSTDKIWDLLDATRKEDLPMYMCMYTDHIVTHTGVGLSWLFNSSLNVLLSLLIVGHRHTKLFTCYSFRSSIDGFETEGSTVTCSNPFSFQWFFYN